MSLENKVNYRGVWWVPGKEEYKAPGILTIDKHNQRIHLRLFAERYLTGDHVELDMRLRVENPTTPTAEIVHGRIDDISREVTLFREGGAPFFDQGLGNGLFEIHYHPNYAFFAKLFSKKDEIHFMSVSFRLNHLGYLLEEGNYAIPHQFGHSHEKYENKTWPEIVDGGFNITLKREGVSHNDLQTEYRLRVLHLIEIASETPKDFWEFLYLVSKLENFLFFAVGEPIKLFECFSFESNAECKIYSTQFDSEFEQRDKRGQLLLRRRNFGDQKLIEKIQTWLKIYDDFEPCISVFTHAVTPIWKSGDRRVYAGEFTNSILNIVQAIEGFYKRDLSIDYTATKLAFNQKKSALLKKVRDKKTVLDTDEIQWLDRNCKPGRTKEDYQLTNVLTDLCRTQKEALSDYIHESRFAEFADGLKDLRNTLTHVNHVHSRDVNGHPDLYNLFNVSQALFFALIMDKSGFEQLEIKKMLQNLKVFDIK